VLGVPYLPASGVKGLLRGWVEVWMDHGSQDKKALIARWFGAAKGGDEDARNTSTADSENAGSYLFFDALPSKPVQLDCDVMTPHMGKWYEKGADYTSTAEASLAPADWHSPVPVPFLVAKSGTSFNFMVAPRLTGNPEIDAYTNAELPRVLTELKNALEWLGAGAKTATGYGRMIDQKALDAQKTQQGLAEAGIVLGEEAWEGAKLGWDKGKRQLTVTPPAGIAKKAIVSRDVEGKNFFDALTDGERKKLNDGKQILKTVHVSVKGNESKVISIDVARQ
jgi:CRISPR-associated protein Cmr6